MRSLLLPDIHTKWQKADSIVRKHENNVDEIVLLGDYFDDFGDSPKLNERTAKWLKEFMVGDKHIALIGNHEFNYIWNTRLYECSGYSSSKKWHINKIMRTSDWHKLKPYYQTQGWYLTHAGISLTIGSNPQIGWDPVGFAEKVKSQAGYFAAKQVDYMFEAGYARGGRQRVGGINWCDFNHEFEPIPEIKQAFGHTPGENPRQYKDTDNWCLDTHLHHCAIIEDGVLQTFEV